MDNNNVTIILEGQFSQPELLYNVRMIEIKRDNVLVRGNGYSKIYFKNKIKSITTDSDVRIVFR